MTVWFLRPAHDEYLEILRYYADQSVELGIAFLDDVDHALALIARHPEVGAPYDSGTRRVLLRRFHHSLIYEVQPEELVVIAIRHQRRAPRSWRERL